MPIPASPPSPWISATVASSSIAMQSHRILPCGVRMSSARWPMAKFGWVPMPITPGSCWRQALNARAVSDLSVVQLWPVAGTYCRSSSQIAHCAGGLSHGAYCVPQAVQMKASMRAARDPHGYHVETAHGDAGSRPASARRELGQVVDADHARDLRHAVDHLFEPVLAEQAVLLALEPFRHGVELVRRDDLTQLGK